MHEINYACFASFSMLRWPKERVWKHIVGHTIAIVIILLQKEMRVGTCGDRQTHEFCVFTR